MTFTKEQTVDQINIRDSQDTSTQFVCPMTAPWENVSCFCKSTVGQPDAADPASVSATEAGGL